MAEVVFFCCCLAMTVAQTMNWPINLLLNLLLQVLSAQFTVTKPASILQKLHLIYNTIGRLWAKTFLFRGVVYKLSGMGCVL